MRAFVALEIEEPRVLDALVAFQAELSRAGADLKLVERENLHFTVKFLGEISESQAREADARLKGLRLSSARVEVRGVGAFPSIERPNVVWVGVLGSQEGLVVQIAQSAIAALEAIGETDGRPFRAHATLARLRSRNESKELSALLSANSDRSFGSLALKQLKLKSSVLSSQGPTYSDVGVYPLT
ncbi:MAG: RNA 2',3'-cyclic phosphodiesterase [Thaumarchaeota archaeon]|nr:RNA 2',3'-cyclic phosphodiesterase [Nitrososphaerota archaeon]